MNLCVREREKCRQTDGQRRTHLNRDKEMTFICPCELLQQRAAVTERKAQATTRGREGV